MMQAASMNEFPINLTDSTEFYNKHPSTAGKLVWIIFEFIIASIFVSMQKGNNIFFLCAILIIGMVLPLHASSQTETPTDSFFLAQKRVSGVRLAKAFLSVV